MEGDKVAEERENLGSLYYEQAKYYFNIEKNYKVPPFDIDTIIECTGFPR